MTQQDGVTRLEQQLSEFIEEQRTFNAEQRQVNAEQKRFNENLEKDMGELRGFHALSAALRRTDSVAQALGLTQFHVLSHGEITQLSNGLRFLGMSEEACHEFANVDIIIEAHGRNRVKEYILAQVSYTAYGEDADSAARNAALLHQLTGNKCHAVVMGRNKGPGFSERENTGAVAWYHLSNRAMAPR